MNNAEKVRKVKIVSILGFFTLLASVLLTIIGIKGFNQELNVSASQDNYSLELNSANKVTTSGDHIQRSKTGGNVTFTYTNVNSSTSGHVTLNSNGTLVNKDIIHSVENFTVNFSGSGSLKARIAYNTNKWGEYFDLASNQKVNVDATHPYFIEFKAINASITINSVSYKYTCQVNQDAETQEVSGSYDITFVKNEKDSSTNIANDSSAILEQVSGGSEYITSFSDGAYLYGGDKGLKLGKSSNPGSITFNFDSSKVSESINTIDVASAAYVSPETGKTDTGILRVYVNGANSYTEITPSSGGSVVVGAKLTKLTIATTVKRAYLAGLSLNYNNTVEPGTPEAPTFEVGFGATDANKDNYTTNSVYANDNALNVYSIDNKGHQESIQDYTYVIKNSSDVTIDKNEKFPAEGVYTLVISYKEFDPIEITLVVGEYVYMTDVSASMSTVTFNTADVLANNLANNLVANIEYSNDTHSEDISYEDFADNGLGLHLLTPKGITHDITKAFGTAGVWKVKVYSLADENMHYDIDITVNAIPVQSISLNQSTAALYVGGSVQLVATVNPNNATNPNIDWASNNEAVATVSDSGLVNAVAVGKATITATSKDGTNVYGECVVTVTKQSTQVTDTLTRATTGITGSQYTEWSGKKATSDAVYAGQSAGGNESIQLRSNNSNSGIVTTASGGKISKVVVEWNSNTQTGRTLNVYAKNNKYSSASDLYGSDSGTLLGTIVKGTSTELTISGDYEYVGVRSNSGAMYLTSIQFVWGEGGSAAVPVYPTAITLTAESNSISISQTTQLTVGYTPNDTNVKNVTFSSSNESVATVSNTGLVTGIAQGSATITATAEAENGTVSKSISITVTPISVTGVVLDSSSTSVIVGNTVTLVATVNPTNATNKNVTWSTSSSAIATVSNAGVVTGIAAGTATITVKTVDGNKTASCVVTVTAAGGGGEEEFSITYTDLPTTYQTGSTVYTAASGIKFQVYNCANYSGKMQWRASSGYLQTTEALELQSITLNDRESNTLTVYGSNTAGSFSTEITGTNDVYDLTGYSYFKVARTASGAAYCSSITVLTGTPTPTDPTSIILNPTSAEIGVGGSKQLSVSYVPSNANQNKQITWTSSNTNVATVSSEGLVSVKSTATAGQTATITAKLTNIPSITATCTITVTAQKNDDHTILLYICGADLESKNSLATGDIQEILKVSGQPDDVNIVIETGGASSWASTYGISSSKLERWHVENKSLVKDASLSYSSMGLTSTLQSFLEYGLNNYPAERTGLILWNHGGGMYGVCYDEKKNDDTLLDDEVKSAVSGALSNVGMSGQKLEWIGYDACLMAVQDIAEMNSPYFNYMIASEESEAGEGWDYDNWVDDLYAKKTTPVILKAICDSFISDNGGVNSSSGDQTLSYLDLSKASAYKTAWEAMAAQLQGKLTTTNKSTFNNAIINNVKHFADTDYDYFCLFDAKDFINKLASSSAFSSFRIDSSYTTAVLNAHAQLVAYSTVQKGAGNAYGLCMYWVNSSQYSDMSVYTTSHTNFTTWRSINNTYGTHK